MWWTVSLEGGPRRVNHAAVSIGDKIYSFGGYCTGEDYRGTRLIDIYIFDTANYRWSLLNYIYSSVNNVPFLRYGHTVVTYAEKAYLWGGRNDEGTCNVLFCFDPYTLRWSCPSTSGHLPSARDGHSACVIKNCMYIFGGYEEEADRFTQDVHCLNFRTMTWTYIQTHQTPPIWRDFHSATAIGNRMYIFGGRGDIQMANHSQNEIYCNKICFLDTDTRTWHHPNTYGTLPTGRRSHSAIEHKGKIYIFGGYDGISNTHFGDFFCFDPVSERWTQLKTFGSGPCARRRHCCCIVGNRAFFFGGTSLNSNQLLPLSLQGLMESSSSTRTDHSDIYVLDFRPSLKTLCLLEVIKRKLDYTNMPLDIRMEISLMTTNNSIASRPLPSTG